MKKFGIIALVIVALLGYCRMQKPSGTWRYKMTIEIETPEGLRTGNAVREVSVDTLGAGLLPQVTSSVSVKGEAVVVDLGERGQVFALMRNDKRGVDYGYGVFLEAFGEHGSAGSTAPEGVRYLNGLPTGKTEILKPENLPMLVRFKDIKDPKTVERVDPNNLEAMFSAGVKLKSATIEITDEPVTWGIEKRLGWLDEYYNKRLDGDRFGYAYAVNKIANSLSSGAFSTGLGVQK